MTEIYPCYTPLAVGRKLMAKGVFSSLFEKESKCHSKGSKGIEDVYAFLYNRE